MEKIYKAILLILSSAVLTYLPCLAEEAESTTSQTESPKQVRASKKEASKPKLGFVYDVNFDFRFDNREYDSTPLARSMTILGARLTPSVGLQIVDSPGSVHRLMVGVDIFRDFGSGAPISDIFRELTLYYKWEKAFKKTKMTLSAGIFPRSEMQGKYSPAFFSDSIAFYDANLEGLILKFQRPKAYYELGCDWMGKKGAERRERFMIFSSGEAAPAGILRLGYSGYMYHFAGSGQVHGVVDNILIQPYIGLDLASKTGLQAFSIYAGWLQAFQNDRRNIGKYIFPHGAELLLNLGHWNVGIENSLYCGTDLLPYYEYKDAIGIKYGNQLYFGDIFYRTGASGGWGIYDRLSVHYEPQIAKFLKLRVEARFHFHPAFAGWQQIVTLKFNLQTLLDSLKE